MKSLVLAALFCVITQTVFAQSYVILQNGVLLSVDESGLIYDFSQFVKTYEITAKGKNYIVTKDNNLTVISKEGFVYKKGDKLAPKKIKANGGVWLLGTKGELSIITKEGFVFTYDKEDRLNKLDVALSGGNFLILKGKKPEETIITTINETKGLYTVFTANDLKSIKLDLNKVTVVGGNYFVSAEGVLFTVSADGLISSKESMGNFKGLKNKGGNFLVESNGTIRTVLSNGYLVIPYLPSTMGTVKATGYNYFVDSNDELITVRDTIAADIINSADAAIFDAALQSIVKPYIESFDGRTVGILSI